MLANPHVFSDKIYELRKTEKFIMLAETGSSNDIARMKRILETDIKRCIVWLSIIRHIRELDDDEHLLNQNNKFG